MPQPQRNFSNVFCCLQHDHCAGMPQHVGRDLFAAQRYAFSVRRFGVTPQHVCNSPSTEGRTAGVYKELRRCATQPKPAPRIGTSSPSGKTLSPTSLFSSRPRRSTRSCNRRRRGAVYPPTVAGKSHTNMRYVVRRCFLRRHPAMAQKAQGKSRSAANSKGKPQRVGTARRCKTLLCVVNSIFQGLFLRGRRHVVN
jgi:hypothetical protein